MDDTRLTTRARTFYLAAGILSVAVALLNVMGPVQGVVGGCSLTIAPIGVRIAGSPNCMYALDLLPVLIPAVAGVLLLLGAWRYRHPGPASTAITALAIVVGVAVAAFPLYTVWWLVDFYRLAIGPMEVTMFAAALGILALAVLAGWHTARYLGRRVGTRAASNGRSLPRSDWN
jgi:hypothetical protein